jgi:hypothetical protein
MTKAIGERQQAKHWKWQILNYGHKTRTRITI